MDLDVSPRLAGAEPQSPCCTAPSSALPQRHFRRPWAGRSPSSTHLSSSGARGMSTNDRSLPVAQRNDTGPARFNAVAEYVERLDPH